MTTDDLAGILREHGQLGMVRQDDGSFLWECICGKKLPEDPELVEDAHYAHQAAVIAAAGWKRVSAEAPEIRYATLDNGKTELDEVVARDASVHLEVMSDQCWWLGIESGGQMVHVNLTTKRAKITGMVEGE